jgi:predicted site-specific integrase-resolvase
MDLRPLIHQAGIAARLSIPYHAAGQLMRDGSFPTVTLPGGHIRADPDDVQRWVEKAKTSTTEGHA